MNDEQRRAGLRRERSQASAQFHDGKFKNPSGAGPELGQRPDDGLIGIRLHRVTDQRVGVGEGRGEHFVVTLKRRGRIAIERRADLLGQRDEVHRLGMEDAVAIIEMIHRIDFLIADL